MHCSERAWIAREWVSGRTHVSIADELGVSDAVSCSAIKRFCMDWADTDVSRARVYDNDRRKVALKALENYFIYTDGVIETPVFDAWAGMKASRSDVNGYSEHSIARAEHVWLLRAEGFPLRTIAERVGLSNSRIGQIIYVFGRQVSRAMRRAQIRLVDEGVERSAPEENGQDVKGQGQPS